VLTLAYRISIEPDSTLVEAACPAVALAIAEYVKTGATPHKFVKAIPKKLTHQADKAFGRV
jgi:hypothetical protein